MTRSGLFDRPVVWVALLAVAGVAGLPPAVVEAGPPGGSPSIAAVSADHPRQMADGLAIFSGHVRPVINRPLPEVPRGRGRNPVGLQPDDAGRAASRRHERQGHVPGKSQVSRLYRLITHAEEPYMPQDAAKLSDGEIAHIAAWIDHGAPYDEGLLPTAKPKESSGPRRQSNRKPGNFWSFQPLKIRARSIEAAKSSVAHARSTLSSAKAGRKQSSAAECRRLTAGN